METTSEDPALVAPPGSPVFYTDRSTGIITMTWPNGRADAVSITSDMLESIVASHNKMMTLIEAQGAVIAANEQGKRPHGRLLRQIDDLRKELNIP